MNIDRMVMAFAGGMILVSLLLSQPHSVLWLWMTAFVGGKSFSSIFQWLLPIGIGEVSEKNSVKTRHCVSLIFK